VFLSDIALLRAMPAYTGEMPEDDPAISASKAEMRFAPVRLIAEAATNRSGLDN